MSLLYSVLCVLVFLAQMVSIEVILIDFNISSDSPCESAKPPLLKFYRV